MRDTVQSEDSPRMENFRFILLSGNTGNGKSRILEALREKGEQVLHLEELAKHKGRAVVHIFDMNEMSDYRFCPRKLSQSSSAQPEVF